jgi:outer membrane immunogenic protein
MLRQILLSSAALMAVTTATFAADLPNRKAPPPAYIPPPVFTWTGFYVGAQIGAGWTRNSLNTFAPGGGFIAFGSEDASGVVGGGHAGYNWQMGNIVLGLEADIEGTSLNKTSTTYFFAGGGLVPGVYSHGTDINWQGSLRPRLGYAMGPALLYVTGGVAFADIKSSYFYAPAAAAGASASFSDTRAGWTIGGGLEYAFNNAWSARVEYRYTDYGKFTDVLPVAFPPGGPSTEHRIQEHAVRVGISYHFGAPASAVVARY